MISGTITDLPAARCPARRRGVLELGPHARPFSVGLNCALGAKEMRAHIAEIVARRRYAGLRLSERRPAERVRRVRREPEDMAALLGEFARAGSSTSSAAAAARRRSTSAPSPRRPPASRRADSEVAARLRLSGLEPFDAHAGHSVRQRRRAHQRHRLGQVPQADHRRRLRRRARRRARAGRERRADHRRQHGRGPARFREGDGHVPQSDRRRARHRPRAGHDRLVEVVGDRGRPEMRAGQGRSSTRSR
jgi:hypothetical protein